MLTRASVSFELTEHCNLRCSMCDHSSPWMSERFADFDGFVRDFDALTRSVEFDELRFCGGEPLLHPRLLDFLRVSRERRYANGLVILTNGLLLDKMSPEVWPLVDAVVVSIYPGVRHRVDPRSFADIAAAHDVLLRVENENKFDVMLLNDPIRPPANAPRLVEAIYKGCFSQTYCHTVHEGRYYRCSRAHLLDKRLALAGRPLAHNQEQDSVDLHGSVDLAASLSAYLAIEAPLRACDYCLGSHGRPTEHRQLNKLGVKREMAADHSNVADFLAPAAETDPDKVVQWVPQERGWWRQTESPRFQTTHRQLASVEPGE